MSCYETQQNLLKTFKIINFGGGKTRIDKQKLIHMVEELEAW